MLAILLLFSSVAAVPAVALEVASLQKSVPSPLETVQETMEDVDYLHPLNDAWLGLAVKSGNGEVVGYSIDADVRADGTLVSLTIASGQNLYDECAAYKEITLAASDLDVSNEIIRTDMPVNAIEFLKQDVLGC